MNIITDDFHSGVDLNEDLIIKDEREGRHPLTGIIGLAAGIIKRSLYDLNSKKKYIKNDAILFLSGKDNRLDFIIGDIIDEKLLLEKIRKYTKP